MEDAVGMSMSLRAWKWAGRVLVAVAVVFGTPGGAWGQAAGKGDVAALEEAGRLNEEVMRLYGAGKYGEAIPLAERVLAIRKNVLGPEHPNVAISLNNLAALYDSKGDYVRAEPLYQRALAIREKVLGPEHPDVAQSLNNLALLYQTKGDYVRAEPLFQRALAIFEKVLGPEHPAVATSLNNLAMLYETKGDYVRAEPLVQRALAIWEKVLGPVHLDVASALSNLAELYRKKGDYVRAEPLSQRALAIKEKMLGPEHPDVAGALNNLAGLYETKGDYVRAEPLFQRALAIREKVLGPVHPDVATSLNNLAALYDTKGDYVRAEPLYQRALAIREKVLGPVHPHVAAALNNLAALYKTKGDYVRAEPLYQRALAIVEKVLGSEHPYVAGALNNLALLYQTKGDYVRAEPLYQRSLAIREKVLGPVHPDVATALNNLAGLYDTKGDYVRAEPLYQRALAIQENVLGPEHPAVATSLNNLAVLYETKGDYVRAEPLFQRALAIREMVLGPEHPGVASSLNNLAVLHWASDERFLALNEHSRAATIVDRNATRELAVGTGEQRRAYMQTLRASTQGLISFHVQGMPADADAKKLAFRTILRRKALVIDAMSNSSANLRERLTPEDQAKYDQWRTVTAEYSALVQRGLGLQNIDVQKKDAERQKLENELSFRSKDLNTQLKPVTIEQVQAALPQGSALVEIFRYEPFNPKATQGENPWLPAHFVAYVLHANGTLLYTDLGEAAPIETAIKNLRNALMLPSSHPKPAGQALYQLVMAPIQKLLGDTKQIYLSPDGDLSLVPFGAFVTPGDHYLAETYSITYLTTGRDIVRPEGPSPRGQSAIFDAPTYGNPNAKRSIHQFDTFRSGEAEAKGLSSLLPQGGIFVGAKATETAMKSLHGPRVLHVSTHGFFEKNAAEPQMRRDPGLSFGRPVPVENALLRSGLAFAWVNEGGRDGQDGLLTALEASQLDLWGTKLVVLSACETGMGQTENGDGVYGLRRAFTIAGAETVVMSLWQVEVDAKTSLMKDYYGRLANREGRVEAMRQAQLSMITSGEHAHPYYWAAFIVSGSDHAMDGTTVEPTFGRVNPGARGCGCGVAGEETGTGAFWWAMAGIGMAMGGGRKAIVQKWPGDNFS